VAESGTKNGSDTQLYLNPAWWWGLVVFSCVGEREWEERFLCGGRGGSKQMGKGEGVNRWGRGRVKCGG